MKTKKAANVKITLKLNNVLTNDPCAICGGRCDPGGFDYFLEGTGRLVCDMCAEKCAPTLVEIRGEALKYGEMTAGMERHSFMGFTTKEKSILFEAMGALERGVTHHNKIQTCDKIDMTEIEVLLSKLEPFRNKEALQSCSRLSNCKNCGIRK